jgi:hypothetical protein
LGALPEVLPSCPESKIFIDGKRIRSKVSWSNQPTIKTSLMPVTARLSRTTTPIIDGITQRIHDEKEEYYRDGLKRFATFVPSEIVFTPEQFINFMQEWTPKYSWAGNPQDRTFMGATTGVCRTVKRDLTQDEKNKIQVCEIARDFASEELKPPSLASTYQLDIDNILKESGWL